MNIFHSQEQILCGQQGLLEACNLKHLFSTVKVLKDKLGQQAYLLDTYIILLLRSRNCFFNEECAQMGVNNVRQLRRACLDAMDGKSENHPLTDFAREIIDVQKDRFQERCTYTDIAIIQLSDDAFRDGYRKCLNVFKHTMAEKLDIVYFKQLFDRLSTRVGEAAMDELNAQLKNLFFIVPPMAAFVQGFMDELIYSLIYRDREMGREVLRLL